MPMWKIAAIRLMSGDLHRDSEEEDFNVHKDLRVRHGEKVFHVLELLEVE